MSCETASMKPCSFLSLILICPVSFLWHLLRSKQLWPADFSIFVLLSSRSSSPSLYHWIFIGVCPTKCSLKMALCPTLTVKGSVKAFRSLVSDLGGSTEKKGAQLGSFQCWRSATWFGADHFPNVTVNVPLSVKVQMFLHSWKILIPLTLIIASVLRPSASNRYFPEWYSVHFIITNLWIGPSLVMVKWSSGDI